jgi:transcriptional regulator GlxA family with amidase domain
MKSRLASVKNWPDLAHSAHYKCKDLAGECLVSERQLERFFVLHFKKKPKQWLQTLRLKRGLRLIKQGFRTKAVAEELFYVGSSHFCREFKKEFGSHPQKFAPKPKCRVWPTKSHSAHH